MDQSKSALTPQSVYAMAENEIRNEDIRAAIDQEKQKIREQQKYIPLWKKVFPWRIKIERI